MKFFSHDTRVKNNFTSNALRCCLSIYFECLTLLNYSKMTYVNLVDKSTPLCFKKTGGPLSSPFTKVNGEKIIFDKSKILLHFKISIASSKNIFQKNYPKVVKFWAEMHLTFNRENQIEENIFRKNFCETKIFDAKKFYIEKILWRKIFEIGKNFCIEKNFLWGGRNFTNLFWLAKNQFFKFMRRRKKLFLDA